MGASKNANFLELCITIPRNVQNQIIPRILFEFYSKNQGKWLVSKTKISQ